MNQQELTLLGEEMLSLLLRYPPQSINRMLRNLFMEYTGRNMPIGEPENFEETLCAIRALFDLPDKAEDKMSKLNS